MEQIVKKLPNEIQFKIGPPPRAPLSAYKLFLQDQLHQRSKESLKIPYHKFLTVTSNKWLYILGESDKEAYGCKAEEQKAKYDLERKTYEENRDKLILEYETSKMKQESKEEGAEKKKKIKAPTAFKLFKRDHVIILKEKNPEMDFKQRSNLLKEMWKTLPSAEKFLYVKRSRAELRK